MPYQDVGQIAPTQTFTATSTGSVLGYFVQGGGASGGGAVDLDYVRLFDITQNMYGNWVFQNQTTTAGTKVTFGNVNTGDSLAFQLLNVTLGNQIFSSVASQSADGVNHAYSTTWGGGTLNGANIPSGTYVGF